MQNLLRLWPLLLCSLFILPGCNQDADTLTGPATPNQDNCDVRVSYDAEITTVMKPVNAADAARLTVLDQSLLLPQRDRKRETFCMQADGSYTIETEILTPENPIQYPDNTVGVWPKPKYARSVNQNGLVSYYNAVGEKIDEDLVEPPSGAERAQLAEVFQTIKSFPAGEEGDRLIEDLLQSIQSAGYEIVDQENGVVTLTHTQEDGASSTIMIDKQARMQVGQMNVAATGIPIGGYLLRVSGQAPNVILEEMVQITYFKSIQAKVLIQRLEATQYHDFTLHF